MGQQVFKIIHFLLQQQKKKMLQKEIKKANISRTNSNALPPTPPASGRGAWLPQLKTLSAHSGNRVHPQGSGRLRFSRSRVSVAKCGNESGLGLGAAKSGLEGGQESEGHLHPHPRWSSLPRPRAPPRPGAPQSRPPRAGEAQRAWRRGP